MTFDSGLRPPASGLHAWRARGFSLIELVVALGLLGVGLVGVVRLFPVGLRASKRSEVISKATLLAQQQLEEIKTFGFDALTATPPPFPLAGTAGAYQWLVTIDEVEPPGLPRPNDLRAVIVKVHWPESGQTRSIGLVTYVAR